MGAMGAPMGFSRMGGPNTSASPWVLIGPITSLAGAAGGSGTRLKTRLLCLGFLAQHFCILPLWWKTQCLRVWTVLLAIITFSLSLLGTFLVRSGVLTSVHSFAADPTRGVFILAILCIFVKRLRFSRFAPMRFLLAAYLRP